MLCPAPPKAPEAATAAKVSGKRTVNADDPLAVMNTLHEVLAGVGLHADLGLPQIVVVGSQSVGKTSVLESLVGRDFLPRGSGIVTRRPLVLQLRSTHQLPPERAPGGAVEWAEFAHKIEEPVLSFEQVRQEIAAETAKTCGDNAGISDDPILLSIFSPSVMDLTLVDLPGLTKVPTGDQPSDISERIRKLVLRYVSHESCLILAVSAANTDLATSDGLALAREVDPKGVRTIGVLTKLDLAEEAGGAVEALSGRVYPLQLGYIGIMCRNEAASRKGVSFEDAVKAEEEFLAKSRSFRHLTHQCGVPHLAKRLHELLLRHIAEALPDLRTRITDLAEQFQEEMNSYGDVEMEEKMGQGAFLLHLISSYARNFSQAVEGRLAYSLSEPLPDRLIYGARLNYIFHKIYSQAIMNFETFSGLPDLEIRAAMRNAAGPKPQLFVPEVAFESLVKRQIEKLEEPSLQCVQLVYEELKHIATQSEVSEMQRFPSLRDKILEVAHGALRKCLAPTNQMVSHLVNIELAHINVDHPDFIGGVKAMAAVQGQLAEGGPREPQQSLQQFLSDADQRQAPSTPSQKPPTSQEESKSRTSRGWWKGREGAVQVEQRPPDEQIRLPAVPTVVTPSGDMTEKERMDVELLKSLIQSYFAIVKRKISDAVPKTVMNFMVNSVRDSLHHDCIAGLYQSDLINSLLKEGDDTRQRREQCKAKLTELRRSQDILAQVRDATLSI
mmetsp:Transcript_94581/g.149560  ORF Transcript_94581/g.149560 Transcript_94581/m.149560 type:complete len:726 (+) Transcript_94581:39-2216(+)